MRLRPQGLYQAYEAEPASGKDALFVSTIDGSKPL
jgi:hypothetical protein